MTIVYFSLGTNLGNKTQNIQTAIQYIEKRIGHITSRSALYQYKPWGFESPHNFVNAAVCVETTLSPIETLSATQKIERCMGRLKKSVNGKYSDRLIDIDLLLYGNIVLNEKSLIIPHPLITERLFVLEPLCEIAPIVIHPILQRTIKELLISLRQSLH